jgi:hypothetical protein
VGLLSVRPLVGRTASLGAFLPKRNYGFEKRQKELTKQRQKEEKKQRKLERSKEPAAENLVENTSPDGTTLEE